MLTIALSKGYLLKEAFKLFAKVGIEVDPAEAESRKLQITDKSGQYSFLLLRPADVPVYVEYGAADLGITGLDVLVEGSFNVTKLLDLRFGRCSLVVAGLKGRFTKDTLRSDLRVATKFVNSAADYFRNKGLEVELIKLYGSVELAPVQGLSDVIVDLTASGKTLKENGLDIIDDVYDATAYLVANSIKVKTKYNDIIKLANALKKQL
jgi:ATP phosphoribosyltransferase